MWRAAGFSEPVATGYTGATEVAPYVRY